MSDGFRCNKCEKWFEGDRNLDIRGFQRGYSQGNYGFHLCTDCSIRLAVEWLSSHNLGGRQYENLPKRKEKWETA